MMNEPRTYRRSPVQFILVMALLVIFGVSILRTIPRTGYILLIPLVILLGIAFLSALYTMNQKTTISEDGISTQSIFGEKSLHWSEVSRVSGRGDGIKLHSLDGDVTVAPGPQLPGYEEVVEWIGAKRPDLFSPQEYGEMKKSWFGIVSLVVVAILLVSVLVGFGIVFSKTSQTPGILFLPLFFVAVIFIVFFWMTFSLPQSLTLEGTSLQVKYLFKEKTLLVDEIVSVDLRFTQNKNGKSYFILLTQTNKKTMRVSGLSPSLPIVYLVLKNWHTKNIAVGNSSGRL